MASYSTGPAKSSRLCWKHVHPTYGICEKLRSRILGYCNHGNHKKDQINQALRRGYTLEVRYKKAKDENDAKKQENDLLNKYDYAWNKRCNGGNNGIRDILPE